MHEDYKLSELILATIISKAPCFMGVFDPVEKDFLMINNQGLSLFGFSDKQSFSEYYTKKQIRKNSIFDKKTIETNLALHGFFMEEDEYLKADGDSFMGMMEIHLFNSKNKNYHFIRVVNIEEKRKSELGIKYQNQRLEALFDNATMGIIMADETGSIISSNHYCEQLFGYEYNELIGQKLEILLPDALKHKHEQHRKKYVSNPQKRAMGLGLDLYAKRKSGEFFPVEISLGHFRNEGNLFVVAFIVDATFKKQTEKELIHQKEEIEKLNSILEEKVNERTRVLLETLHQLEKSQKDLAEAFNREKELNELKSRFVSMASHEFRTPLSGILSSVNLIKKYSGKEEQEKREKHIYRIEESVNQLTDILEEFLSVSKLEEGKVQIKSSLFSLPDLIQETLSDLNSMAKKGQKVTFQHQGDPNVYMDKSLLMKTLINLISNAIKFSPEDATIQLMAHAHTDFLEIVVKDEGIGISEEDQKHLFERFFRGGNASNIQGTGLGLHIVLKYLDLMKGKIFVKSQLNQGTTFTLLFNNIITKK